MYAALIKVFSKRDNVILLRGPSGSGKTHTILEHAKKFPSVKLQFYLSDTLQHGEDWDLFEAALYSFPLSGQRQVLVLDNCDTLSDKVFGKFKQFLEKFFNVNRMQQKVKKKHHHSLILTSDILYNADLHRLFHLNKPSSSQVITLQEPFLHTKENYIKRTCPFLEQSEVTKVAKSNSQFHSLTSHLQRIVESQKTIHAQSSSQALEPSCKNTPTYNILKDVTQTLNATQRGLFTTHQMSQHLQKQKKKQNEIALRAAIVNQKSCQDTCSDRGEMFQLLNKLNQSQEFRLRAREDRIGSLLNPWKTTHNVDLLKHMFHAQLPNSLPAYIDKKDNANSLKQLCTLSNAIDLFTECDLLDANQTHFSHALSDMAILISPLKKPFIKGASTISTNIRWKDERHPHEQLLQDIFAIYEFSTGCETRMDILETMWASFHLDDGKKRDLTTWSIFPPYFRDFDEKHLRSHNKEAIRQHLCLLNFDTQHESFITQPTEIQQQREQHAQETPLSAPLETETLNERATAQATARAAAQQVLQKIEHEEKLHKKDSTQEKKVVKQKQTTLFDRSALLKKRKELA